MKLLRKIRSGLWLFLCFVGCLTVSAQYRFDHWNTDNGLPQNGVREITQTPDGYLWFTTFDGLVRFDGMRFTIFNKSNTKGIINNRFTGIFADHAGTIYATTMEDGILTVYRDGVFTSYTSEQVPGHYISRVKEDAYGGIRVLVEDEDRKGRSWYKFEDGQFTFIEKQPKVNVGTVVKGRSGTTWTIDPTGVTEERDGEQTRIPLDLSKLTYAVNTFEDSRGDLWLGENRVYRIRAGEIKTFSENEGLSHNSLYHSFWEEADGSVWFSSGGASSTSIGLVQIRGDQVSLWGNEYGLTGTAIQSVFVDREGTPWLATDRGLFRRRKQIIQSYSKPDGLDHTEIYPIYRDSKGDIWTGSSKGLSIYHEGKFRPLELKASPSKDPSDPQWRNGRMSVQSLWEDGDGVMWIGLDGGIFTVKNSVATLLYPGSHVFAIKGDSHGNIWAATNKGLLRFHDYRLEETYTTEQGLPNEFMTFIFEDRDGKMWFGGLGGLSKFEDGRFTNFTTTEGLIGNYVRTIYQDADGAMWIGTYDQGMSRFKDGRFVNYGESEGLYNSGVFAIEEDANGNFWISSNRGIYRVRKQELNDLADGRISRISSVGYGKDDGMLSNECNGGRQPASLRDSNGRFWFPTQDGVAIVDPEAETTNPLPPSVVIENVVAGREDVDFRSGANIEPGQRDVEIRYTGVSFIKPEQIKFQYKLEGRDADWVDAGTRRTAYYSYLPPGNYTFRVRASNSDGVWNETGASVGIYLIPHFYQTNLFLVLCILSVAILLLLIWKISVHQLMVREQKLTKLVAERTAELAEANRVLQDLANSDGLTKIGNRRRFTSFLTDEWNRAARSKSGISLVLLDIDNFKLFNDTYGHHAGDDCLQMVAESLTQVIKRPTDLLTRFGGEEFAIVLGATDGIGARQIAEEAVRSINDLKLEHSASVTSPYLTVSVGVATLFATMENSETDLIKSADRALYRAKANGRNQIVECNELEPIAVPPHVIGNDRPDSLAS